MMKGILRDEAGVGVVDFEKKNLDERAKVEEEKKLSTEGSNLYDPFAM